MTVLSRRSVLLGAAGTLGSLAGCLSESPSGAETRTATSSSTSSTPTTETTTTAKTTTTTTTPEPCTPSTPEVDVELPERPDELTKETARSTVVVFEKAYKHARLAASYDLTSYSSYVVDRRTHVEATEDGYRVKVKVHADFSSSGNESGSAVTASGGYQYTYRVTDRRFVREGETLACWGGG